MQVITPFTVYQAYWNQTDQFLCCINCTCTFVPSNPYYWCFW